MEDLTKILGLPLSEKEKKELAEVLGQPILKDKALPLEMVRSLSKEAKNRQSEVKGLNS